MDIMNIEQTKNHILNSLNQLEELEKLYREVKSISQNYYSNGKMIEEYTNLKKVILTIEHKLDLNYICDTKIEYKNVSNKSTEHEDIIDYIVYQTRKQLISGMDISECFDKLDVTNECYMSSIYVDNISKQLGIECERLRINPAFTNQIQAYELFEGLGYHYFNIITIKDKKYLIDCTYKQFFKTNKSSLEILGLPEFCAPKAGTFMILNNDRKKVSDIILKKGWIEATNENLKHYFDGFALSFRNGLYYENMKENIYETNYTSDNYITF